MAGLKTYTGLLSAVIAATLGVPGVAMASGVSSQFGAAPQPDDTLSSDHRVLHPLSCGDAWGDDTTHQGALATPIAGTWQAQLDQGSMWKTTSRTGAQAVWLKRDPNNDDRKLTGYGVGVALLDTGIAPVEGLATSGKIVNGPDLSFDSQQSNSRYLDGFGHGTHMAGIIAGKDSTVTTGNEADPNKFVGMAPNAKLINVKVGASDGAADVSQMIAAIDWVVQNRNTNNIRVLNLSYGTKSTQSSTLDPLAHAVENAWRAGIVVVVAAGNGGQEVATTLTMPAVDPYVLAVGSSDNRGTNLDSDIRVGAWTNKGTTTRYPDLLAPGKSLVSLAVPGSMIATKHPGGFITGDLTKRMFRGTGTSQSAAVVSGAVALLLQRNPSLTPDKVKGLLKASAKKLSVVDPTQGAGVLDVLGAVKLLENGNSSSYTQTWPVSTGYGLLEASRAGSHVADPGDGSILTGEKDIFGVDWDATTWATASKNRMAWTFGGTWRTSQWAGTGWSSGSAWAALPWARNSWTGQDWTRYSWTGLLWTRLSWTGMDWERYSWSGSLWSRYSWQGSGWSGLDW